MKSDSKSAIPQRIFTLNDAWLEWLGGEKFPIAFFGDSTVDGANTSEWERNTVGNDNISPNAFPKKLEGLLRDATNNQNLRIYNAGFSGQIASWAVTILEQEFGELSAYHDVKMIGIGFGINDRLVYPNAKAYKQGFKANIKEIITWCFSKGIQPFLLTTQATLEPGVHTTYEATYPLRTSEMISSAANEAKCELASEYNLQLLDLNKHTEMFLQYSSVSAQKIISDRLHFGDVGHQFEAEVIFSNISPQTIFVDHSIKIDFSNQKIAASIPEDWLTLPVTPTDCFKVYVNHIKPEASDRRIMGVWVYVSSKKSLALKAFKGDSPDTYIKVNGATVTLTGRETFIDQLELGLYKLEAYTGESTLVDFKGFVLE